jgi:hypothetical protein
MNIRDRNKNIPGFLCQAMSEADNLTAICVPIV